MLFGALHLKISKRKVQTKLILQCRKTIWDMIYEVQQVKADRFRNVTHQNAAYLWETPIGGRMEAGWGQCTRSYFHEYPL